MAQSFDGQAAVNSMIAGKEMGRLLKLPTCWTGLFIIGVWTGFSEFEVSVQAQSGVVDSGVEMVRHLANDSGIETAFKLPGNWFENDAPPPVAPPPVPPPTREFNRTGVNEITFDDVSFEILPGDPFERGMLTENIRRLDGLKIRVRGFIRPSFKQSGIQKFVFVRDNQECCFGPGAAIYDCILVELGNGKSTDFTVRPVTLVGTFCLEEYSGPDGNIWAIFRMRDATVQ